MSEKDTITTVQELAIVKAAEEYDDRQDCTCDDPDAGTCWYHLTDDEQMNCRVQSVADRLEMDPAVVRRVISEDRR